MWLIGVVVYLIAANRMFSCLLVCAMDFCHLGDSKALLATSLTFSLRCRWRCFL